MPATFVHLHLHSEFSLVDGLVRIKPLVKEVADAGMPAVALTDQSNLFGMVKFYKAARAAGLKPIIGADIWVAGPEPSEPPSRLVLLCRDRNGYRHLTELLSLAYLSGQERGIPVVRREWLESRNAGLIALSAARDGDVGRALLAGHRELALERLREWQRLFGDDYVLEIQRCGREGDEAHLVRAVELAVEQDLLVVATNDVRFIRHEDFEAHEARVCIQEGRVLDDPRRPRPYSEHQYLRTPEEMAELFSDLPEALTNTVEIARRCTVELELGRNYLPDFPIPDGMTMDTYFTRLSREGLEWRLDQLMDRNAADFAERRKPYDERLQRELDVIISMGFPGYFLIVADFIQWAKDNDIPVGPGRGSGAGSLVAYALKITDLDPLAYDLLFERFLNPERVSMPDFDVDFCMDNRDRVIDYVAEKYGRNKVSQIATHGSMAAKAVVRDVGRVMGHPYGFVDRIAKLIPFEIGMTLDKALEQEEELRKVYRNEEEVAAVIDMARKLEGLARNVGKHAGGVVIAPTALTDFTPLYCEQGSTSIVSQFDKDDVEAVGLVKFDFLGLRTLTIIDWAVKTINRQRRAAGEDALDIMRIDMADQATFDLLQAYDTTAVFQLESRGMKDLIKRLQPDCFEDIIALVALFRPGPLQSGMVDDFIARKKGEAPIEYPHPDLEPILKPTYGIILYQEQVMQIAQVLAGYSLGGADLLRRAMGKKKREEMDKQGEIFLKGAVERGVDESVARYIFDLMAKFAGYGFNKSHSAAYALLSYQTAWLKAHYPAAFMAAVLSSDMDNTDKVVVFIEDCRQAGLEILPPDINRSEYMFTVTGERRILYGLGAIKGVGLAAIEGILAEREANGPFADLTDFCKRVDLQKANKRVLEALIKAGAMDSLGPNRATHSARLPTAMAIAEKHGEDAARGIDDMFGFGATDAGGETDDKVLPEVPEWEEDHRLSLEKETLGLYLTGHPIERFLPELANFTSGRLNTLAGGPNQGWEGQRRGERSVVVAGLVVGMRIRKMRNGRMAFVTLDDRSARIEVKIFDETFQHHQSILGKDKVLVVEGKLGYDDYSSAWQVTAERLMDMEQARSAFVGRIHLRLSADWLAAGGVARLKDLLTLYREGHCPIRLQFHNGRNRAMLDLGDDWRVQPAESLIERLRDLLGDEAVRLEYRRRQRGAEARAA